MFEKEDIKYYNLLRDDVIRLLPKEQTFESVLDVGCGEGINLEYLKKYKGAKKVDGIEVNSEIAKKAQERVDYIINQSIEDPELELPKEEYDLILCLDVLEHLYDPWNVLKKLEGCLKPNGIIVSSIPNIQHWNVILHILRGRWDYKDAGFWDNTHLRFFTNNSIRKMVHQAGLAIIKIHSMMGKEVHFLNYLTLKLFNNFFAFRYVVIMGRK